MAELLSAHELTRRYGDGDTATIALRGVSFDIRAGEYLAVIGRSGSGKSTLLNLMGLLDRPTDGSLRLLGERVEKLDDVRRAAMRNRHIGFVFQFHHLLPEFSVRENLLMPVRIAGQREDRTVHAWTDELIELLGLEDVAAKLATE